MKSLLTMGFPIALCASAAGLVTVYCFILWLIVGFLSFAKLTPDAKR
jgi:hypothetical protein